jgi:hypothetical protein
MRQGTAGINAIGNGLPEIFDSVHPMRYSPLRPFVPS